MCKGGAGPLDKMQSYLMKRLAGDSAGGRGWERVLQSDSCPSNSTSQPQRSVSGPQVLNLYREMLPP